LAPWRYPGPAGGRVRKTWPPVYRQPPAPRPIMVPMTSLPLGRRLTRAPARAAFLITLVLTGPLCATPAPGASPAPPAPSQSTPLPTPIAQALARQGLPATALAAWVQPVGATFPSLAHRAQEPRPLASLMKLITTGAALQALGPAY